MRSSAIVTALIAAATFALVACKADTPNPVADADATKLDLNDAAVETRPDLDAVGMPDMPSGPPVETVEVVSETGPHAGVGSDCIVATCPPGTVLVGGGASWDGSVERLDALGPTSDSSYRICASASAPVELRAEAYCAVANVATTWVTESVSTEPAPGVCDPDVDGNPPPGCACDCFNLTCPGDSVPLVGGGSWPESFDVNGNSSRGPQEWGVCGCPPDAGPYPTLDLEVVCIEDALVRTRLDTQPQGSGDVCLSHTCEDEELLLGGVGLWSFGVRLDTFAIRDDAWTICGESVDPLANWTVGALCIEAE